MLELDYRESHTQKGKGTIYHSSFEKFSFRKEAWIWEKKIMDKIFDEISTQKSEVLDFACGTGRILNYLQHKFENLTGVDISPEMLGVANRNLVDVTTIQSDLTRDNLFEKNNVRFDIITSYRFFLNAQDSLRKEILQELYKIIKPNGYLVINNHGNASSPAIRLQKLLFYFKNRSRSIEEKYIINSLEEKHFLNILKQSGFEVEATYHRNVIPVINEKTNFNVKLLRPIEDILSSIPIFRHLARNVVYVLRKV